MKKALRFLALTLMIVMIGLSAVSCSSKITPAEMAESAKYGVVRILGIHYGNSGSEIWLGSGFLIGEAGKASDTIVTNQHVVTSRGEFDKSEVEIYLILDDESVYRDAQDGSWTFDWDKLIRCSVLYTTSGYPDYAILKSDIKVPDRIALPIQLTNSLKPLDNVYALGFPGVADEYIRYGSVDRVTSTSGSVSRFSNLQTRGNTSVIEHSADINSGNSGGPLLNDNGAVVGINTYSSAEKGASNYSITIDYVEQKLNEFGIAHTVIEPNGKSVNWETIAVIAVAVIAAAAVITLIVLLVRRSHSGGKDNGKGAYITGQSGEFEGRTFYLKQGETRIGRMGGGNELEIAFASDTKGISRRHCRIRFENGRATLEDCASSYGTFLNDRKLDPNESVTLNDGDIFWLAERKQSFVYRAQ